MTKKKLIWPYILLYITKNLFYHYYYIYNYNAKN